jgi:hypothetical protein
MISQAEHEYHVVELEYANVDCIEWCRDTFGESFPNGNRPDRWFRIGSKIYFLNAADHLMFLLRWA